MVRHETAAHRVKRRVVRTRAMILALKWWMSDSMLSFIDARGGGTILWSSTLMAPVGILFKHYGVSDMSMRFR
jgi:hypothetical protein